MKEDLKLGEMIEITKDIILTNVGTGRGVPVRKGDIAIVIRRGLVRYITGNAFGAEQPLDNLTDDYRKLEQEEMIKMILENAKLSTEKAERKRKMYRVFSIILGIIGVIGIIGFIVSLIY